MFPVTDSNLRADALVQQVLSHYALGEIVRCGLHLRGLNDTYKVETGKNDTYYLRVYRAGWRSSDEIDCEMAMLQHLARHGVKVSLPVARSDGRLLTSLDCAEGTRWAAVLTSAPGQEIDYKAYAEAQAVLYGEAAGAIHHASDSFAGRRLRPPLDLAYLLDRPLALVASAISHRAGDLSYIAELGARLRGQIECAKGLEIGFCHGDLHGQNACEAGGVLTFYDFDCCGWGYRAYDLAVFPWAFALIESAAERIEALGRAFFEGYARRRTLSRDDISVIPAFVAVRQIWLMGLHLDLAERFGRGWVNERYFDRHLKILREWEKNFLGRPAVEWLLPGASGPSATR